MGTLFIDILARTEGLEKDMQKVRDQMDKTGDATKKAGDKAKAAFESFKLWNSFTGRGMTGITLDMLAFGMALQAVRKEIMYVYENIDKIPGIPAIAVQNVNEFKVAWREMRNHIDAAIAGVMSFGVMAGKALGLMFATQNGRTGSMDPGVQLNSLDQIRIANDIGYFDKLAQARTKLSEARKADAVEALEQGRRVEELRKQAEEYRVFAATLSKGTIDTLQAREAEIKAYELEKRGDSLMTQMRLRVRTDIGHSLVEQEKSRLDEMSQMQRIFELRTQIAKLEAVPIARDKVTGEMTPMGLETFLKLYPQLIKYQQMLREEFARINSPAKEFATGFIEGFKEMSTVARQFVTGIDTDFNKVLKTISDRIIDTFFNLALINPILNYMFKGTAGVSLLPAFFGIPHAASGGPQRGWTMVGEQGPELANFGSGGSVMDNTRTRGAMGGGGNTYVIDARGADASVEARLRSLMLQLAGPGVVEHRAMSTIVATKWRRGAGGAALA